MGSGADDTPEIETQIIGVSSYIQTLLNAYAKQIDDSKKGIDNAVKLYLAGAGFEKHRYSLKPDFKTIVIFKEKKNE